MRTAKVRAPRVRSRSKLLALFAALTVIGTLGIAPVLAVHDQEFQLDGDTSSVAQNNPNAPAAAPAEDWETLFNSTGGFTGIDPDAVDGFNGGAFERDFLSKSGRNGTCEQSTGTTFCTVDASTYATGSKDTLDITDWQCNRDNNVNSKIDIMNAYAAQYIDPANGDRIMYFGLDKNKDNGSNNVAFWFLQSPAGCESPGGAVDFSGAHVDGDVLVVSAFTNGGGVSNIDAYRWDGDDACIDNPANPAACDGLPIGSGGDCKAIASGAPDSICATTNSGTIEENDNITTSWLTSNGTTVGHTVVPPDFFEGGINLTEAFENVGGAPSCFSTFIGNTRSSPSLTATLFDFAAGQLGECESDLSTDAGDNGADGEEASPTSIGTGSVSSGTDTATLTIDGTDNWAGTLTWYLCGPDEDLTTCDPDEGAEITSRTVDQDSSGADFISGTATLTSAGKYCWTAVFDPDDATEAAGVSGAQDDGTDECFTVDSVTPEITTIALSGPVSLGAAISDDATLTGTANQPGSGGGGTNGVYETIDPTTVGDSAAGTITFNVFGPDDPTCDGDPVFTSTINVSGDDTYNSGDFTPDSAGTYLWVASYSGDLPNTNDVSGSCGEANETSVVGPVQPAITTTALSGPVTIGGNISDVAHLSGTAPDPDGSDADGTITFKLYGPDDATCANEPIFESTANVSGDGDYNSGNFAAPAAGTYRWVASYSGDPPNTLGVSGACNDANEASAVGPKQPAITTTALSGPVTIGGNIYDVAHLSGTAPDPDGSDADGTITFKLYGPNDTDCSGDTVFESTVDVSGDGDYNSGNFAPVEAGTYRWIASYSGDPPNTLGVSGACNDDNEASVIGPKQPAITTEAMSGPVPLGASISDTATLTGTALDPDGSDADGTITFTAYGPSADTDTCETVAYTSVVEVSGDGTYVSSAAPNTPFIPTEPGIYNWIAVYSGDPPNTLDVAGECGDDNEFSIVQQLTPVVTTEQTWRPQDEATITVASGGGDLDGTVDFELFDNASCTGTALWDQFDVAITVDGAGLSASAATNNTDFDVSTSTQVWWKVTYDSDNLGHTDAFSICVEDTSLEIDNSTPPGP